MLKKPIWELNSWDSYQKICEKCNEKFQAVHKSRKYCDNCKELSSHTKIILTFTTKKCIQCGKTFNEKSSHKQFYCSAKCRKKFHEKKHRKNKELTHFEIFKHDNFRCQYCGKTPADGIKLVIDHIYPISKGGQADRFNLTTSCEICNLTKSNNLLSIKETVRRWNNNPTHFTYNETMEFWKSEKVRRERRNAKQ